MAELLYKTSDFALRMDNVAAVKIRQDEKTGKWGVDVYTDKPFPMFIACKDKDEAYSHFESISGLMLSGC